MVVLTVKGLISPPGLPQWYLYNKTREYYADEVIMKYMITIKYIIIMKYPGLQHDCFIREYYIDDYQRRVEVI